MAVGTPTYLQNLAHPASVFRVAQSAGFVTGGILASNELPVSQQATPGMSVILGPGRAQIVGTSVSPPTGQAWTTQAGYTALNDANLSLTVTTSNPTQPRIDAVYVQIQDAYYSGSTNLAVAGIVAGTPGASPVAPAVPTNSILLAYIAVGANVTSIVTANITYQASVAMTLGSQRITPVSVNSGQVAGGTVFASHTVQQLATPQRIVVELLGDIVGTTAGAAGGVGVVAIPAGGTLTLNGFTTVAVATSGQGYAGGLVVDIAAGTGTVTISLTTAIASGTVAVAGLVVWHAYQQGAF